MNNVQENLDCMLTKLKDFLKTETVVGEPLVIGEITLVPLITVGFGCGTGGGSGVAPNGADGTGSGGGCAATVSPTAVLVVKNEEVTLIPLKGKNNLNSLASMVPDLISKINAKKNEKEKDNTEKSEDNK